MIGVVAPHPVDIFSPINNVQWLLEDVGLVGELESDGGTRLEGPALVNDTAWLVFNCFSQLVND
jgi:hypothetical protein